MIRTQLRLRKCTILYFYLIIEYLLDTNFLYLIDIPHFIMPVTNTLIFGVYIFLFWKEFLRIFRRNKTAVRMIAFYLLSYLFLLFFSLVEYPNQSLYETLVGENESFNLLQIIFFFPMFTLFVCEDDYMRSFKFLNILSSAMCLLGLLQSFVYEKTGYIFMDGYFVNGQLAFRYGNIRILSYYICNIMAIYNFYMFYVGNNRSKNKTRGMHLSLFLLIMCHQLVVSQSRQMVVYICVSMVSIVLLEDVRGFGFLKKISVSAGIVGFLCLSNYITELVYSLSAAETAVSTQNRLYAFEYYYHYFLKHPITGFGFANTNVNRAIVRGRGVAFVDDVGIIGQMAKLGIFVIPMYVLPMIRCGYDLFKVRKDKTIKNYLLILSIYCFIIAGSVTFIVLNQQFILFYPIFWAICEYLVCKDRIIIQKYS